MSSSERTPLLPTSVSNSIPSRNQVQNALPSKQTQQQLSHALGAYKAGKLPSQQQISKIIDLAIKSDFLKPSGGAGSRTARLGEDGARVLADVKQVLDLVKRWGEEKNGDDLLQNIVYDVREADIDVETGLPSASQPSKKELNKDSQKAVESFRTIANLLITSPAFRKLGSDAIFLTRDVLADAAEEVADEAKKAADAARPSEKERQNGADFKKIEKKGKETAYHAKTGLLQAQAREGADDVASDIKQYFDEKLPKGDEAKDKLIERLKEIVTEAQKNKQYHQAINTLVGLVKKYATKVQDAAEEVKENTEVDDEDDHVQQAGRDLKAFVEKLAGKSLDPLIEAAKKAGEDVKNDPKLSEYFDAISAYVDRLLHDEGYVVSQRAYRKGSSLYDDGQSLLTNNPTWKADANNLQKEIESFLKALTDDETTSELVLALERLGDDLAVAGVAGLTSLRVDGSGLYRDIVDVIIPRTISLIKQIPIPRVEFKSEDVDLVIDDLNLESVSFIPDSIRFIAHNDFEFTQGYATYASEYDSTVRLRVKGLHVQASNIAYWFSKKTGFLPFEDSGLLDVQFGPEGINFDVTLENATDDDRESFFVVKNVDVAIHGFDYQIRQNQKWFATWLAKPALRKFLLHNITNTLELQITEMLKSADLQLFALQQRTIAATNARPSPANYLKAIFSSSVFPTTPLAAVTGSTKLGGKGIVKYGRKGEYVLHIGVDEDLFPGKPVGIETSRDRFKAKVKQTTGVAVNSLSKVKDEAADAAASGLRQGARLTAEMRERKRREARQEGWRSDAFDL